jgi:hypothetical protein
MVGNAHKQRVLATLRGACKELQTALNLSIPAARYDPAVIPTAMRNEIPMMVDDLNRILRDLEGNSLTELGQTRYWPPTMQTRLRQDFRQYRVCGIRGLQSNPDCVNFIAQAVLELPSPHDRLLATGAKYRLDACGYVVIFATLSMMMPLVPFRLLFPA